MVIIIYIILTESVILLTDVRVKETITLTVSVSQVLQFPKTVKFLFLITCVPLPGKH